MYIVKSYRGSGPTRCEGGQRPHNRSPPCSGYETVAANREMPAGGLTTRD
jgi:hypothetical protein